MKKTKHTSGLIPFLESGTVNFSVEESGLGINDFKDLVLGIMHRQISNSKEIQKSKASSFMFLSKGPKNGWLKEFHRQISKLSIKPSINDIISWKDDYIARICLGFKLTIVDDYWFWAKEYEPFKR